MTDNCARHDERPGGSHRILLNSLKDTGLLLLHFSCHGSGLVRFELRLGIEIVAVIEVVRVLDSGDALLVARLHGLVVDGLTHDC